MQVNAELSFFEFLETKYTLSLDTFFKHKMVQAARIFLRTALAHIPVDTGFAASAFKNIGDAEVTISSTLGTDSLKDSFATSAQKRFEAKSERLKATFDARSQQFKEKLAKLNQKSLLQRKGSDLKKKQALEVRKLGEKLISLKKQIKEREVTQFRVLLNRRFKSHDISQVTQEEKTISLVQRKLRVSRRVNKRELQIPGISFAELKEVRRTLKQKNLNILQGGDYYYPKGGAKVRKNASSGSQFGTPPNEIFKIDSKAGTYSFNFASTISYFLVQDVRRYRSGPWKAMENAIIAATNYLQTSTAKGIPSITDFLLKVTSKIDGTSVRVTKEAERPIPGFKTESDRGEKPVSKQSIKTDLEKAKVAEEKVAGIKEKERNRKIQEIINRREGKKSQRFRTLEEKIAFSRKKLEEMDKLFGRRLEKLRKNIEKDYEKPERSKSRRIKDLGSIAEGGTRSRPGAKGGGSAAQRAKRKRKERDE